MRIHIVEDDVDIADMLQIHLEFEGVEATATTDHFDGLLNPEPWEGIDVAVVDIMLPGGVSGYDILRYLKESQPQIRRVVLSAIASQRPELDELADRVLEKPVDIHTFLTAVGIFHG